MSQQSEIDKLRELIKDIRFAMLTTIAPGGMLRSRPMGMPTSGSSPKAGRRRRMRSGTTTG